MSKFIPYDKMSKKQQKEYNKKQRLDWGMVHPSTKTMKSKKDYTRKKKHKLAGGYDEDSIC